MAEQETDTQRPRHRVADGEEHGERRRRRPDHGRLSAARAAQAGLRQIAELTGKEPDGVTAVERSEDGWTVCVEVVEDRRIPSSTDILAIYQADLGRDGDLVGYRRTRRYSRGHGGSDDGESW